MNVLNQQVLQSAIQNNICAEWAEKIKTTDVQGLLKMYIKGIDFCLDNNFPSNDFLKDNGGDLLQQYGIFIDEETLQVSRSKIVLLGGCSADARYNSYDVSEVFIKHHSKATIGVYENAIVTIDAFDDSVLNVVAADNAKVFVNIYGRAKLSFTATGKSVIKGINKNKNTY